MARQRKTAKERSEHKRGLVRVIGFLTVVGLVSAGFSIRAARAEVANKTLLVGRQMSELADSAAKSDKTEVSKIILNGQPVFMASTVTEDSPRAVIDRYNKYCEENRAHSTEVWKQLADNNKKEHKVDESSPGAQMAESGGTLRGGNDHESTVLCFVKAPGSKATLKEALASLAETGELNSVGFVRYAYAKKTDRGKTHVLAMWTTEKFNVKEFVPEGDRDVPGSDFAQIPRPEESVRIFSIQMEGAPYGVNVYQSKGAPEKTVAMYDQKLGADGWFSLDIESKPKRNAEALKGASGRLYEKDGAVLTLVSKPQQDGTTVTALGMAGATEHESRESRR